jgi:hypothetical protein
MIPVVAIVAAGNIAALFDRIARDVVGEKSESAALTGFFSARG